MQPHMCGVQNNNKNENHAADRRVPKIQLYIILLPLPAMIVSNNFY